MSQTLTSAMVTKVSTKDRVSRLQRIMLTVIAEWTGRNECVRPSHRCLYPDWIELKRLSNEVYGRYAGLRRDRWLFHDTVRVDPFRVYPKQPPSFRASFSRAFSGLEKRGLVEVRGRGWGFRTFRASLKLTALIASRGFMIDSADRYFVYPCNEPCDPSLCCCSASPLLSRVKR